MKVKSSYVGNVYRAVTQFIDKDDKKTRLYVIVDQKGKRVAVAKLKGIKKFLPDGKNADKALVSIFIIISLIIFVRGILNYDMQGSIIFRNCCDDIPSDCFKRIIGGSANETRRNC